MLLIIGVLIMSTTAIILSKLRVPSGVSASNPGWMSEQWLAEYRASGRR